jgi:DUF3088 family protein
VRDTLFVLTPGFEDKGQTWFCPFSAQVIGFLTYYPQIKTTLELREMPFPRPRKGLVELVGEANQSMPCLVLADGSPTEVANVTIGEFEGRRFVSKTIEILRYLATTRGVPLPH